jgi:hypothetical protein
MRTHILISILLAGMIILTCCTTLKRYKSLSEPAVNNSIADIDLFGLSLSKPETGSGVKSLWDLSADAQSQLIKILNSRYPENDKFLNSFNYEYMKDRNALSVDNYSDRDLRLIFSISKKRKYLNGEVINGIEISPADRLEYLRISLVSKDSVLRFKGWNKFTTEYGSVDIGDVSFSKTLQLNTSGSLSVDKGKTGNEISGGVNSSLSNKEDQSLKYRYLVLNGRINDYKIEMEEEGTREIDLTGNIIADVSFGFNTFPETLTLISGLSNTAGEYNSPEKVSVEYYIADVPGMKEIKDTIKAELVMEYVYRNVITGSRTFQEWDDRVKYYTGTVKKTVPLFTSHDYVPDLYCIGTEGGGRELLKIKSSDNSVYALKFRSYDEASSFYKWMMHYFKKYEVADNVLNIGGQQLIFRGNTLTYNQIKGDIRFRILSYY